MTTPRALHAIQAGVAAVVVALGVVVGGGAAGDASGSAPATGAAHLVPADTLVYVHLSTDRDRAETASAAKVAEAFPSWPALRDGIVKRLQAPGCDLAAKALRTADEAALAIFDTSGGSRANSLVLVDTGKEHPGAKARACGALSSSYVGRFLAIGQPESLSLAAQLQRGKGTSLADAAGPKAAFAKLPADRAVDGWLSRDGLRRLLAPQGGLLGIAGLLFDQPALKGAAFGLSASGDRARFVVHSQLDAKQAKAGSSGFKPFRPTLAREVPADAMAYVGASNLAPALQRLLGAAGTGAAGGSGQQLGSLVGALQKPLLQLFPGEAALVLTAATPAPVLTILAHTKDEAASRRTIAALPASVRKQVKTAVFDGKIAVSTDAKGIAAVTAPGRHLTDTENWSKAVGNTPDLVSSIVFLDFSRLLQLGEETGLGDSTAYQAAKADLQKVDAIGAQTSGSDSESTAEISLLITP